jgi:hypothetical protein
MRGAASPITRGIRGFASTAPRPDPSFRPPYLPAPARESYRFN